MRCPRCLNTDPKYFYKGSRGWYCRRCISFGRAMIEEDRRAAEPSAVTSGSEEFLMRYPLTPLQKTVSRKCSELIDHTDVLLYCVCGAGKTELVVESISKMLKQGKKVCFAIPRRQVVLELQTRLAEYFPRAVTVAVCGGHTRKTDGDLIICTTHQLYRYGLGAFDLLILDEPDAFPFRGNPVLHGIAETACRGHRIFLTATPDRHLLSRVEKKEMVCLKLFRRPHGYDLPEPKLVIAPMPVLLIWLLLWLREKKTPRMVFVPTIREAALLHGFLSLFMKCFVCTSKTENRDRVIEAFRKQKAGVIVATTVLERGVTIPGADICVFHADHGVFDEASLVQMAGRAGRSFQAPEGRVLFLETKKGRPADQCRKTIREANACTA